MNLARSAHDRWYRVARDPYTPLLGAVGVVQVTLSLGVDLIVRPVWAWIAAVIFAGTCVGVALVRLRELPTRAWVVPSLIVAVAACWRLADREFANGLGALIVIAVLWMGHFGTRAQVWLCIAAGEAVLLVSAALTPEGLPRSELGRSVLTLAVLAAVGPTLGSLVRRNALAAQLAAAHHKSYELLVRQIPLTTVAMIDEQLRCVTVGGHLLSRRSMSAADFVGWHVTEFFEEQDRAWALAFYERGRLALVEEQRDIANGKSYEFQAMPMTGPGGEPMMMTIARDVTDRRTAELERQRMVATLAVSEASFREAFEGAPIGMALTTFSEAAQERFLQVNAAFAMILGRSPADLADRLVDEFTHPEDIALTPDLTGAAPYPVLRKRFLRPSGRAVWVEVSYTVVRGHDGAPSHVIKQIQDLQTIKQSEQALLDALEQQRAATASLRELDKIRTELVATVSHELRTPLTSIRGYLELLTDEQLTAGQQALLDVAVRNTERLGDLVDDLLVLVRLDAIDSVAAMSTCDVSIEAALSSATDTVRPEISDRNQTLTVTLPAKPVVVRADSDQLDRALVNLLSNASKYTATRGRINVDVSTTDATVQIAVSDTGIGIPADEQTQLFTRFFRASTARAQSITGNGLGLAIVKTIVERHAGEVHVESTPGVGTTFTVTLPLAVTPIPALA